MQCSVSSDSRVLATASQDSSVRLWEVTTGKELFKFQFESPCRSASFSLGEELLVTTQDQFMSNRPHISILRVAREIEKQEQHAEPVRRIEMSTPGRITRAAFSPVNDTIITAHEDGHIRRRVGPGPGVASHPVGRSVLRGVTRDTVHGSRSAGGTRRRASSWWTSTCTTR